MGKDKGLPLGSSTLQLLAEQRLRLETGAASPSLKDENHLAERDGGQTMERLLRLVSDLYDSAPVGYFHLDRSGGIRAVNGTGAEFLGESPSSLIGCCLDLFLSPETRPVFHTILQNVFANDLTETCEVALLKEGASAALRTAGGDGLRGWG